MKLRGFLLVLNMDVCITLYRFYATENVGSVQLSEKCHSIESLATIPSIYIYKYWLVYFTWAESVKMLYFHWFIILIFIDNLFLKNRAEVHSVVSLTPQRMRRSDSYYNTWLRGVNGTAESDSPVSMTTQNVCICYYIQYISQIVVIRKITLWIWVQLSKFLNKNHCWTMWWHFPFKPLWRQCVLWMIN